MDLRRHLQVPGWSHGLHQGLEGLAAGPVQQAVERFENRQIGFRASQPLGTPAARDDRALWPRRQLGEDVLNEAALADAGFARYANDEAVTVLDPRICPPQFATFGLPANRLPDSGRRRARPFERSLAPEECRQLLVHFAG